MGCTGVDSHAPGKAGDSDRRQRAKGLDSVQEIAWPLWIDKICQPEGTMGKGRRFSRLAFRAGNELSRSQHRNLGRRLHYSHVNTDEPNAIESPQSFHDNFCDGVTASPISSSSEADPSALAHAARQRAGEAGWGNPPPLRGRKI